MKKQQKKYSRPRKPFDKKRIEEENLLREKYGLKNKLEIWKADAAIRRIRNLAKDLIVANDDQKKDFVKRLQNKGFKVESIADVLSLNKEDWLKRRLQTILFTKGLALTPKQARQLITHRHISVDEQIVDIPSYMVKLKEESNISLNIVLKTIRPKSKEEKIKEEIFDDIKKSEDENEGDKIMEELIN